MPVPLIIAGAWVAGGAFAWLGFREIRKTTEAVSEPINATTNLAVVGVALGGLYVTYKIIQKKGKLL